MRRCDVCPTRQPAAICRILCKTEGGHGDVEWADIMIGGCPTRPQYQGYTVAQLAAELDKSPHDVVFDVLEETELEVSMFPVPDFAGQHQDEAASPGNHDRYG